MTRGMQALLPMAAAFLLSIAAAGMTADEIYDRMEAEADALAAGSMVATVRFENVYRDGTSASNLFGSLSRPNRSLIYFIEPEDVRGTIFLTHEADDPDGDARLWLYLPLLGIPKELVSGEEREGSFAGSSLSYEDLSDTERRADYEATLIREEALVVGELARAAYVIEATAKPGADVETRRTVIWVDTEFFIMLRMEGYNDLGNLESTMDVLSLAEFEGKLTVAAMLATDVTDESTTTITFIDRHRPAIEIADEVFSPDALKTFDASAWGF